MQGSFVWPLGGVGEHWHVFFQGDEGCSESDWLRFSLDLWRFTGQTRYLDVAERLLENQYATNQCPNGGYGMAHLDGDAAGPVAALEKVEEWPFCCSFHGPLGLHFLKGYLAAGSQRGVFVNFPFDFTAPVEAAGRQWSVAVRSRGDYLQGRTSMEIQLAPREKDAAARTMLWVRIPAWACAAKVVDAAGHAVPATVHGDCPNFRPTKMGLSPSTARGPSQFSSARPPGQAENGTVPLGYLQIERQFKAGERLTVDFQNTLVMEGRRFLKVEAAAGKISRIKDVAVLAGPDLLFATPVKSGGRPVLLATLDSGGRLGFPVRGDGQLATVPLPSLDASEAQIARAVQSARPVFLRTWPGIVASRHAAPEFISVLALSDVGKFGRLKPRRLPFMFDLVVVPAAALGPEMALLADRAQQPQDESAPPIFGQNLETRPEIWSNPEGWKFTPRGLLVAGGDIGLIDGEGYADYRFEFQLTIPKEGQGIAGWVVRCQDGGDCLMFQLQTADSTFKAPEFKTRPNTLRPHRRAGGQWQIADPVTLPKQIRKGEPHQIAVECRQGTIDVFLDGQRIYTRANVDLRGGTVGFRATGRAEQGLFRAVSLKKL